MGSYLASKIDVRILNRLVPAVREYGGSGAGRFFPTGRMRLEGRAENELWKGPPMHLLN